MNFLNVGPSEMMVIVLIAILVVGPKRLAETVQAIGRVSRKMRKLSGEFVGAIRSEIQVTENDLKQLADEAQGTTDGAEGVVGELTEARQETDQSLKSLVEGDLGLSSITEDIRSVQREAQGMMQTMLGEVMSVADMNQKNDKEPAPQKAAQTKKQSTPSDRSQAAATSPEAAPVAAEATPKATTTEVTDQAKKPADEEPDAQDSIAAGETSPAESAPVAPKQEEDSSGAIDTVGSDAETGGPEATTGNTTEDIATAALEPVDRGREHVAVAAEPEQSAPSPEEETQTVAPSAEALTPQQRADPPEDSVTALPTATEVHTEAESIPPASADTATPAERKPIDTYATELPTDTSVALDMEQPVEANPTADKIGIEKTGAPHKGPESAQVKEEDSPISSETDSAEEEVVATASTQETAKHPAEKVESIPEVSES